MKEKPVIGIVAKRVILNKTRENTFIRDEVKQAVFDNGGIAIGILTPNEEINYLKNDTWRDNLSEEKKANLIAQINICDGLILQGGRTTDSYECWIAKYAYDHDIPILGICAGQNNLVIALGGSTFEIPNFEKHYQVGKDYVHNIKINKCSKFYQMIGEEEIKVNSRHIRSIDTCPLLDKVAFCDDGYPDVVESKEKTFYLGVRFHPESLYLKDKNMNKIFKEFISVCQKEMLINDTIEPGTKIFSLKK